MIYSKRGDNDSTFHLKLNLYLGANINVVLEANSTSSHLQLPLLQSGCSYMIYDIYMCDIQSWATPCNLPHIQLPLLESGSSYLSSLTFNHMNYITLLVS